MSKTWTVGAATAAPHRTRRAAAWALRRAGAALEAWAVRLHAPRPAVSAVEPVLEFHAEAGAPEGALYIDGQLVGHLVGVQRL